MRKHILLFILFILTLNIYGQSIDDVIAIAMEENHTLVKLKNVIINQQYDKPSLFQFKSSSLSVSGDYILGSGSQPATVSASLNVPIISQAGISAQYSDLDNSTGISLNITPFAAFPELRSWDELYRFNILSFEQLKMNIKAQAEQFYMQWIIVHQEYSLLLQELEIAEHEYSKAEIEFNSGLYGFDTVKAAYSNLIQKKTIVNNTGKIIFQLISSGIDLFGSDTFLGETKKWNITITDLLQRINSIKAEILTQETPPFSIRFIEIQNNHLSDDYKKTAPWQPELNFNISSPLSFDSIIISADFTISFDQFQQKEKEKIRSEIDLTRTV